MGLLVTVIIVMVLVAASSFAAYLIGVRMKERYSEDRQNVGYRDAARVERERDVTVGQLINDMPSAVKIMIAVAVVLSVVLVIASDQGVRQDVTAWYVDVTTPSVEPAPQAPPPRPVPPARTNANGSQGLYKVVPNGHRGMLMRNDGRMYGFVRGPGSHWAPLSEIRLYECDERNVQDRIGVTTSDGSVAVVEIEIRQAVLSCTDESVSRLLQQTSLPVYGPQQFYQQHIRQRLTLELRTRASVMSREELEQTTGVWSELLDNDFERIINELRDQGLHFRTVSTHAAEVTWLAEAH